MSGGDTRAALRRRLETLLRDVEFAPHRDTNITERGEQFSFVRQADKYDLIDALMEVYDAGYQDALANMDWSIQEALKSLRQAVDTIFEGRTV